MLAALVVWTVLGQQPVAVAAPSVGLKAGDAARIADDWAPVGTDRDGYLLMLESLAAGDKAELGGLIAARRGFLATAEMRVDVVAVEGSTAKVRVISGVNHAAREGYVGLRWLERLPEPAQGRRVDPKVQALAELKAKRDRRSNPEQQILAEVFRDLMARAVAPRHVAVKPVAPGAQPAAPTAGASAPVVQGLLASPVGAGAPTPTAAPGPAVATTAPTPTPAAPASAPAAAVAPPARKGHLCGAATRSGEPCRRYVVKGEHCYQHGG